jgi:hypothetical protein
VLLLDTAESFPISSLKKGTPILGDLTLRILKILSMRSDDDYTETQLQIILMVAGIYYQFTFLKVSLLSLWQKVVIVQARIFISEIIQLSIGDEAERLLTQEFFGILLKLLNSIKPTTKGINYDIRARLTVVVEHSLNWEFKHSSSFSVQTLISRLPT